MRHELERLCFHQDVYAWLVTKTGVYDRLSSLLLAAPAKIVTSQTGPRRLVRPGAQIAVYIALFSWRFAATFGR
jgi:hypothetical protein